MTPRVVLATDRNPAYSFFAPIAALLWRKMGFEPTVILVGSESDWALGDAAEVVDDALLDVLTPEDSTTADRDDVATHFVSAVEGFSTATVAQVSRLFAPVCLGFAEDDVVLTCDVDYWPIRRPWFEQAFAPENRDRLVLFHANACLPRYPMNLSAPVRVWRDLLPGRHPTLGTQIALILDAYRSDSYLWGLDETILTAAIDAYTGPVVRLERRGGPPYDRIDRSDWPVDPERLRRRLRRGQPFPEHADGTFTLGAEHPLRPVLDAHLLRPGFTDANWPLLRPILEVTVPEHLPRIDEYREAFWKCAATEFAPDEPRGRRKDRFDVVMPWYVDGALDEIDTWDLAGKVVLEWGGGWSSLWWASRGAIVRTIETHRGWASWLLRRGIACELRDVASSDYCRLPLVPDIAVVDGADRSRDHEILATLVAARVPRIVVDNWNQPSVFVNEQAIALMAKERGVVYRQRDHRDAQTAIFEIVP